MKKWLKRLVSVVLSISMLVVGMAFSANAADTSIYSLYESKIKKYQSSTGMYYFHDMTGNGTKELIINEGVSEGMRTYHFFTYKDGKLTEIKKSGGIAGEGDGWHSAFYLNEKKKPVLYRWSWGGATVTSLTYTNGKIIFKDTLAYRDGETSQTIEEWQEENHISEYKYNGCSLDDLSLLKKTISKKKSQSMKVSPTSKTYKAKDLKKKAKSFSIKVSSAKGSVSYKSNSKNISVTSKGKVKIKKGTKKGTYKITVTAKGNSSYEKCSKTVTIKVK